MMTEQDLGKTLMRQEITGYSTTTQAHEQAIKTLKRHRRGVRALAGLTIFCWVSAAAGILVTYFGYMIVIWPNLSSILTNPSEPIPRDRWLFCHHVVSDVGAPLVVTSAVAMVLAAICTVLLVFISRRVTLRQISLSLAEISEQLAQLLKSP